MQRVRYILSDKQGVPAIVSLVCLEVIDYVERVAVSTKLSKDMPICRFVEKSIISEKGKTILKLLSNWDNFEYNIHVSASIGILQFPQDGNALRPLLKYTDVTMYQAKTSGKSSFQYYQKP
ncbi:diguanylate cyclase [Halalkalibacter akibai]|uniref:GGDEF domain-containing protein n=1 Tax=Halalkalibacter akibai (strain ATCC 43226 / DSM 21942 / CIP 109018 / JCM 9157 / 1139) TaxID=1236973 RepID=W4QYS2_HALA3|nr:diguanylate cyclase [Halalkalibacter akibai]GAE36823.1 hypothetical protein JCM9157_4043 [Halalkalibacter akibai JCM 9157]